MELHDLQTLLRGLPPAIAHAYYPGREDAWMLAHRMPGDARIADLRRAGLGKLLDRPLLRPVVAGCGGTLRLRDMLALGYAGHALGWEGLSPAAQRALNDIYAAPWLDFELGFAAWGNAEGFYWHQTSRPGYNLVVQLGFPSDHAALMGRYLPAGGRIRHKFEFIAHPVRRQGRPTLAWARIDFDPASNTALIEEVQSDWLRYVRENAEELGRTQPRTREARAAKEYETALRARYEKLWPRVMLLAAVELLRDQIGCAEIYMHRPEPGAVLKSIHGTRPPRSIYSDLPKSFGFAPTRHIPGFLGRRHRELRRACGRDVPLFWRLRF